MNTRNKPKGKARLSQELEDAQTLASVHHQLANDESRTPNQRAASATYARIWDNEAARAQRDTAKLNNRSKAA